MNILSMLAPGVNELKCLILGLLFSIVIRCHFSLDFFDIYCYCSNYFLVICHLIRAQFQVRDKKIAASSPICLSAFHRTS